MSSLVNGDDADDFFFGNATGDHEKSEPTSTPLPLFTGHKHDSGVNSAYTLSWSGGNKTKVTGGGKMYAGDFKHDKTIDFLISAVALEPQAHYAIGADLSCADGISGVRHAVLLDWPDMQVPKVPLNFWVNLIKDLSTIRPQHLHVQCAGGNGRTGTTLAILLQLATGGYPSVEVLVKSLRAGYRQAAVETKSQFDYIAYVCNIPVGDVKDMIRKDPVVVSTATKKPVKTPPLEGLKKSGTTTTIQLSPEKEKIRKSKYFLQFDADFTSNLPIDLAVAYYEIWESIGKPILIKKGNVPYAAKVPTDRVYPEHIHLYKLSEDKQFYLSVALAHVNEKK